VEGLQEAYEGQNSSWMLETRIDFRSEGRSQNSTMKRAKQPAARKRRCLIYYAPLEEGGLLDYAVEQLLELERQGQTIACVGSKLLLERLAGRSSGIGHVQLPDKQIRGTKFGRGWSMAVHTRQCIAVLEKTIRESGIDRVLFASYAEYFAPLWASRLRSQRERGVRFGVVIHDPVRDFVVGPNWWHRMSVKAAYSFVDVAFVHQDVELETGHASAPETVTIPHGAYDFPIPDKRIAKSDLRKMFDIPLDVPVVLSFGHIRDGKNLDLLIDAISEFPDVHLLVAGREQSTGQKPIEFYKRHAETRGIESRCRWENSFISREEVWKYFDISDYVALLYSSVFKSASGVLNTAVQFRKPVLASSGEGPVCGLINRYRLGFCVEPDSAVEAAKGMKRLLESNSTAAWAEYENDNSWKSNAEIVANVL